MQNSSLSEASGSGEKGGSNERQQTSTGYWKEQFKVVAEVLAVSGLRFIVPGQPVLRRVMWMLLILIGLAFMFYQVVQTVLEFLDFPVDVNIIQTYENELEFPAVTICHENLFSKTKVQSLGLYSVMTALYVPYVTANTVQVNLSTINLGAYASQSTNWKDVYRNISFTAFNSLQQCSFGGDFCTYQDLTETWTSLGRCYTINDRKRWTQTRPGSAYGLEMILIGDQGEYIAVSDYSAGFRILLHNATDYPDMNLGFKVGPGNVHFVKVFKSEHSYLGSPWGTCSDTVTLEFFDTYTLVNCRTECLRNFVTDECGCTHFGFPQRTGDRVCSIVEEQTCVQVQWDYFIENHLQDQCQCPTPCYESKYTESVSLAPLASYVVDYITNMTNVTAATIRQDYSSVFIYYPQLDYTSFSTQKSYSALLMFNDIGGALGLLLGSTFFTVVEIFDILAWAAWDKRKINKKAKSVAPE